MSAPRVVPGPPETEEGFMGWVVDYAHLMGWFVAHARPARTIHGWRTPWQYDGNGFPDLFLVRPPRAIGAELKRNAKTERARARQLEDEQQVWLDLLGGCPIETYVWRPADRPEIQRLLAR